MKKIIITSAVAATIGISSLIMIQPKNIETIEAVKYSQPMSAPEAVGRDEITEVVTDTTSALEAPQNATERAIEAKQEAAVVAFDVMTAVFYANETMDSMTNDVRTVVLSRPHLFTQDNYKTLVDNIRTYLSQYMRHEFEYRFGVYDELNKWASTEPLS